MAYPSPFRRFWHRVLTWSGPLLLLFFAAQKVVEWLAERLWFQGVDYGYQFDSLMMWRCGTFSLGASLMALWLGVNAQVAWRNAARSAVPLAFFETSLSTRLIPIEDKLQLDQFRRRATIIIVVTLSWMMGLGFSTRYALFVRAFYSQSTGHLDQASNFDLGFFLFQLPLWQWMSRFCMVAIIAALVLVVAIYLYEETIGFTERSPRWSGLAAKHLATLWVILLLWKAADCLLSVPLSFVNSGNVAVRVFDPSDIKFGWTTSALLALMAPFLALLSGAAIARRPRYQTFLWGLLWMVSTRVIPVLLPVIVSRSFPDPEWPESVSRHLHDTRTAWGLDNVQRTHLEIDTAARFSAVNVDDGGSSLPLWPASSARDAMNRQLDARNAGLEVERVYLERRNGTLVYVGLASPTPPNFTSSWRTRHFRSPEGSVLQLQASRCGRDGAPLLAPEISAPLLFGPADQASAVTFRRSDRNPDSQIFEPNTIPVDDAPWVFARDEGAKPRGVSLQSFGARLTLATRFWEPGILQASPQGKDVVLWHRSAAVRCRQLAPFLDWPEHEARPLLLTQDNATKRLVWVVPGIIWSDDYPDSATPALPGTSPPGMNYGRMAAVGVVDARSGKISLYALGDEPFVALYRRAFPGLILPPTALPNEVRANLRPSAALLKAQCLVWSRYHEVNPSDWVTGKHDWRPLLSALEPNDTTLRPLAPQSTGNWTVMAFGSFKGQAGVGGNAGPLVGILGVNERDFGETGQMRFVEWRPQRPLPLPDLTMAPSARPQDGKMIEPPPTLIGVAPIFDGAGLARGVLATRGEVRGDPEDDPSSAQGPLAQLKATVESVGIAAGVPIEPATPATDGAAQEDDAFREAKDAWMALQNARQKGNWSEVARSEKRLDEALKGR